MSAIHDITIIYSGYHKHADTWRRLSSLIDQFHAMHARHHQIRYQNIDFTRSQDLKRLICRGGLLGDVSLFLEEIADRPANQTLIIHDQYIHPIQLVIPPAFISIGTKQ